jgi:toxin secretion/phage lysis holin
MNELLKAHFKLWSAFTDIKLWLVTAVATPVLLIIETYLFSDWEYLKWLVIMMFLDLVTGVLQAIVDKTAVLSGGLRQTVIKVIQYFIFLITVHVLSNYKVDGHPSDVYDWVTTGAYAFLMGIEAKSIWENLAGLNSKFDPSEFIDRLKNVFPKKKE